jgi:hypothetical protein
LYGFFGTFLCGFLGDFSNRWLSADSGELEKRAPPFRLLAAEFSPKRGGGQWVYLKRDRAEWRSRICIRSVPSLSL